MVFYSSPPSRHKMKNIQTSEILKNSRLLTAVIGDIEFRKNCMGLLVEHRWFFDESIENLISIEVPGYSAGANFVENIGMETEVESGFTSLECLKAFVEEPLARIIVCALPNLAAVRDLRRQVDLGNFSIEIFTSQADGLITERSPEDLTITTCTESCFVDQIKKSIQNFATPRGLLINAMAY